METRVLLASKTVLFFNFKNNPCQNFKPKFWLKTIYPYSKCGLEVHILKLSGLMFFIEFPLVISPTAVCKVEFLFQYSNVQLTKTRTAQGDIARISSPPKLERKIQYRNKYSGTEPKYLSQLYVKFIARFAFFIQNEMEGLVPSPHPFAKSIPQSFRSTDGW